MASKNTESFDQHFSIKHIEWGNGNCSKTDPYDTVEHLNELRLKNINKLVICHLNINSLSNKFDQLKLIIKNKVDILAITETKLHSSFPDSLMDLGNHIALIEISVVGVLWYLLVKIFRAN